MTKPICMLCSDKTDDPVYIGAIRCKCKMKLCIGRCCKEIALGSFDSTGDCTQFMAKVHIVTCRKFREREEKQKKSILIDTSGTVETCNCPEHMN